MHSSTSHIDQPIPLRPIISWWLARCAVYARVPLEDFLEWRKRIYEALYRRSHYPLPFTVVIEEGTVKEKANPAFEARWEQIRNDPTGEEAGEPILTQLESEELARQLEELENAVARNNILMQEVNEQTDALQEEEVDGIRRGAMLGPTTRGRPPKDRRRPHLSFPWEPVLAYFAIACFILCEAYQFAVPFLDYIGVDTTNLAREWQRNPLGVLSGAGFALASSVGLFILWYLVLRSASLLSKTWDSASPGMTALRVGGLVGLGCILLVGTYLLATMRHDTAGHINHLLQTQQGQPSGAGIGQSIFFFSTLIVSFSAAYIHHRLAQSAYWVRRRETTLKQEQWDIKEEERILAAERIADRRNLRQQERESLERQRTLLHLQRRALVEHVQAAQRERRARLDQARQSTEVYARSLLAALAQDHYYYVCAANRCQAQHLVSGQEDYHGTEQPPLPFVHALLPAGNNGQSFS